MYMGIHLHGNNNLHNYYYQTDMFIYGEVVAILGSNGDNSVSLLVNIIMLIKSPSMQRGFAEVKWSESQHTSTHRVGSEGKVC